MPKLSFFYLIENLIGLTEHIFKLSIVLAALIGLKFGGGLLCQNTFNKYDLPLHTS